MALCMGRASAKPIHSQACSRENPLCCDRDTLVVLAKRDSFLYPDFSSSISRVNLSMIWNWLLTQHIDDLRSILVNKHTHKTNDFQSPSC